MSVEGQWVARLRPGIKPGGSRLARIPGPLAKSLVDTNRDLVDSVPGSVSK